MTTRAWLSGGEAAREAALPAIVIECVTPVVDAGRFAVKRVIGDELAVGADIYKDGHDLLAARVLYCGPGDEGWRHVALAYAYDDDRWCASFPLDAVGRWSFTVEAWTDTFGTWRSELEKKIAAEQDVLPELVEGSEMLHEASRHARGAHRASLDRAAELLGDTAADLSIRIAAALDASIGDLVDTYRPRAGVTRAPGVFPVQVDRPRAAFAAWYEMFPRSATADATRHGTFRSAADQLARISALGFDVVYLPPIHPIGISHRKGPNNSLHAGPGDPGSPWAIGNAHGGHMAVSSDLGTLRDFRRFVARAEELGLDVALDYALQCSPDHPWVREHPEWFFVRPDGTVKYAENPPKKYEDIYPLDFWCDDRQGLWNACRDVLLFWISAGVRTFRVDNPHTKPFAFWEWLIAEVQRDHPDVVFLAEAFTRPKPMKNLAKLGFTQSYTYFTWRNTAAELAEYLTELTQTEMAEYFRANFFANTPDILHEYLQHGGRAAFQVRLLLAATLSPVYGIYSGFELGENVPLRPGSEEYIDSEKYQVRSRGWGAAGNLDAEIARINHIRRRQHALQRYTNISFHESGNEQVLFYLKAAWRNDILCAVNVDPHNAQEALLELPLDRLGIGEDEPFEVEDLLSGTQWQWQGARQTVCFDPAERVGYIWRVIRANGGAP